MVFEAHCTSFPCTELLIFNYAKVKTVFHSMAHLKKKLKRNPSYVYCARLTETCHGTCILLLSR